jgi:cell division septation protein DedD
LPPAPTPIASPPVAVAPTPSPAPARTATTGAFTAANDGAQASTGTQLIQIAAVGDIPKARELQRQLRAAGFDAYWESVRSPNKKADVVRVRISIDRATRSVSETLGELKKRGFDPILVNP